MPKLKLTAAAVERIKPTPDKQVEYFDSLTPGFALRISPKGAKSWVMFYRIGSKLRRLTLGRFPALSLADARAKAGEAVDQADEGIDPAREKKIKKRELLDQPRTFEAVAELFIQRYNPKGRELRQSTRDQYRQALENNCNPIIGHRPIETITRADMFALLDVVEDERGVYAANRTLAAVRKMFNWALSQRALIDMTPIGPGMARGGEKARNRVLDDSEIKPLWEAADVLGWPNGDFFKVLMLTGQRRTEVSGMRWQELNLDTREWTVPEERAKNRLEYIVPLSSAVMDILTNIPKLSDEFVFTSGRISRDGNRKPRPISGYSKFKKRLDNTSGVTDWRFHDLRRTIRSKLSAFGIPEYISDRVLAHKKVGLDGTYNKHDYLDEKRGALNAWMRYVALILDANAYEAVMAYRDATRKGDDDDSRAERKMNFQEAIRRGGPKWEAYLDKAKDPGAKVVKLRGAK